MLTKISNQNMDTVQQAQPLDIHPATTSKKIVYETRDLNLFYGKMHALKDINLAIYEKEVTAIIGPSGCGKSSFLKSLNRMVDLQPDVKLTGSIKYQDTDILNQGIQVESLRTLVGMVFQRPNPFPKSIYNNIAYGPRIHGIKDKQILNNIVETALKQAFLWDEVKDNLNKNAYQLSGGQQQRLCIARTLAIEPHVILMDEPTSSLDPKSTAKVEQLIAALKDKYTIVIVTHNMQQATRISDRTAFFLNGERVEHGKTERIFNAPRDIRTKEYVTGQFG